MKFSELDCCPFCGHDEYYTKQYVYGSLRCNERFDGQEAENGEMYESLNCGNFSGRAYCSNCDRYLGNVVKNTVRVLLGGEGDRSTEKGGAE